MLAYIVAFITPYFRSYALMEPSCVLFIPVSSPSGIGEYMRSLIIAKAIKQRWPNTNIHFILNNEVSYLKDCPYQVHACQGSPTKDVVSVNNIIEQLTPDLVIFDASGRAKQFKQAKAVGAKVAFISQHNKKRNRGLKLNRLFSTDIHWVVQPEYCMKPLGYWQRAKLSFFNKKRPQNIGPVFELSNKFYQEQLLGQLSLVRQGYFIFNAGSGGHKVEEELAADIYYQAALAFYQQSNIKCVVIFGSNYPKVLPDSMNIKESGVTCIQNIENKNFIALLSAAQGCVVSAGDTLLQCIALHKLSVAAPVSPDQPVRLKLCENKQLVLAAKPTPKSLVEQAQRLIDIKSQTSQGLINSMKQQAPSNALEIIVDDIALLFASKKANGTQQSRTANMRIK